MYFTQALDEGGSVLPHHDKYWEEKEQALAEYKKDHEDLYRGCTVRVVHFDREAGRSYVLASRKIDRYIPGPITVSPRFLRVLTAWAEDGCMVSGALLTPSSTLHEVGNYLMANKSGVSYVPWDKIDRDTRAMPWANRKAAVTGRFGRTVKKFIVKSVDEQLTVNDYEKFSDRCKAEFVVDAGVITLVSGEKIREAYHYINSSKQASGTSLMSSCMRYSETQPHLSIYTDNPDKIQLAVIYDEDGLILARALVWKLDDGRTFVDRVFGAGHYSTLFDEWAKGNGYIRRAKDSAGNHMVLRDKDGQVSGTMFCTVSNWDFKGYPHIDTFTYLDTPPNKTPGRLTNDATRRHMRKLVGVNGSWQPCNVVEWPNEPDYEPPTEMICNGCGVTMPYDRKMVEDGIRLCPTCYDIQYPKCVVCERREMSRYLHTTKEGKVCGRCFDDHYRSCQVCGIGVRTADLYKALIVNGYFYHFCSEECWNKPAQLKCYSCNSYTSWADFCLDEGVVKVHRLKWCNKCAVDRVHKSYWVNPSQKEDDKPSVVINIPETRSTLRVEVR